MLGDGRRSCAYAWPVSGEASFLAFVQVEDKRQILSAGLESRCKGFRPLSLPATGALFSTIVRTRVVNLLYSLESQFCSDGLAINLPF